jgi:hypothetical protein
MAKVLYSSPSTYKKYHYLSKLGTQQDEPPAKESRRERRRRGRREMKKALATN